VADYYDMKDKMRRSAQDEQASRLRAKIPVPVSPEIEGAPNAGMTVLGPSSEPAAPPQASVRGVPGEMTAEYIPPAPKPSAAAPAPTGPSPAMQAAARLLRADTERKRFRQERWDEVPFYYGGGAALGAAIGGGLAGPIGVPVGAGLGAGAGTSLGLIDQIANANNRYAQEHAVEQEYKAAQRAISEGLRNQAFTPEELEAALGPGWTVPR